MQGLRRRETSPPHLPFVSVEALAAGGASETCFRYLEHCMLSGFDTISTTILYCFATEKHQARTFTGKALAHRCVHKKH